MTLRQLEILRAVIRCQTTMAAARLLGMSQPAVSNAVRQIEAQLGFPLFERVNNRLFPTEAATIIHEESEPLFAMHAALEERVGDLRADKTTRLRILSTPPLGHGVIPAVLAGFSRRHPRLRTVFDTRELDEVIRGVESGKAELGFGLGLGAQPSLEVEALAEGRMVCVCRPDHPLARRDAAGNPAGSSNGTPRASPPDTPPGATTGSPAESPTDGPAGDPASAPTGSLIGNPTGNPTGNSAGNSAGTPNLASAGIPGRAPVTPADLAGQRLIALDPTTRMGAALRDSFAEARQPLQAAVEVRLCNTACVLVAAGMGAAVVDPFTAAHHARSLVVIPYEPAIPSVAWVFWSNRKPLSETARRFVREIRLALSG